MSGDSSGLKTWQDAPDISASSGQLKAFTQSQAGAQYAALYDPNAVYSYDGNSSFLAYNPSTKDQWDVSGFVNAFKTWNNSNQQTQTNWQNYSTAVGANQGGEGDNTITSGPAVSQRNSLLGALANAGRTTAPTPGLAVMGAASNGVGGGLK